MQQDLKTLCWKESTSTLGDPQKLQKFKTRQEIGWHWKEDNFKDKENQMSEISAKRTSTRKASSNSVGFGCQLRPFKQMILIKGTYVVKKSSH